MTQRPLRVDLLVDGCLVEVFADDGAVTVSDLNFRDATAVESIAFADAVAIVSARGLSVPYGNPMDRSTSVVAPEFGG